MNKIIKLKNSYFFTARASSSENETLAIVFFFFVPMKTKVFIDGHSGTTGLRIYERLAERQDIEVLQISEALRKEPSEVKKYMAAADIAFLCLPDQAAIEAVSLAAETKVRIIDTSTAHRTAPDWVYGFPELSQTQAQRIAKSDRVGNPGCHASGVIAGVQPLTSAGILPPDYPLVCFSLTGYSGGGKKMTIRTGADILLRDGSDSTAFYGAPQGEADFTNGVGDTGCPL